MKRLPKKGTKGLPASADILIDFCQKLKGFKKTKTGIRERNEYFSQRFDEKGLLRYLDIVNEKSKSRSNTRELLFVILENIFRVAGKAPVGVFEKLNDFNDGEDLQRVMLEINPELPRVRTTKVFYVDNEFSVKAKKFVESEVEIVVRAQNLDTDRIVETTEVYRGERLDGSVGSVWNTFVL